MNEQDRARWLEARRAGLGASDVPIILGLTPWGTPWQVWMSKTQDDAPDPEPSEAMKWGLVLEDTIVKEWAEREGLRVEQLQVMKVHETFGWMRATPDALAYRADVLDPVGVVEVKTITDFADEEWDGGQRVPAWVQAQVQWQMLVTSLDVAFVVAFNMGRRRLFTHTITADTEYQEELQAVMEAWWTRHVVGGEPPLVEADDNRLLASLWPTSQEETVEVDVDLVVELRLARTAYAAAKERKDTAEARLKQELGEADTAVCNDEVVATWKSHDRAGYTVKPATVRQLRVKGER